MSFLSTFAILTLALALLQRTEALLSNDDAETIIRDLAKSNTTSKGLYCSFNIIGDPESSILLKEAAIECTGGTLRLSGGPALTNFTGSFKGIEFESLSALPGGAIKIEQQSLTIANSRFENLTPKAPASLILSEVNATVQSTTFKSNTQATAGAIQAIDNSNLVILNSVFSDNVGLSAGAITVVDSAVYINASTFANNTGQQGGGLHFTNGSENTISVANSVFENNRATSGGAIYAQDCKQAIYHNNILKNNSVTGSGGHIFLLRCGGALVLNAISGGSAQAGGGAYINAADSIGMYHNEWTNNHASSESGGVDFQSIQSAAIANDTFSGNKGHQGGAIFSTDSECSFESCTFKEEDPGYGLKTLPYPVEVNGLKTLPHPVKGNTATLNGGSMFRNRDAGLIHLCLFESNKAKMGGAIFDVQTTGGLTDNVFSGNVAQERPSAAVYRVQASGKITNNKGLSKGTNFQDISPISAAG